MTAILGIVEKGAVWMGGDSASSGNTVTIDALPKVFRNGEFIMGCSGDARLSDLIRFCLKVPRVPKAADLDAFMATKFVSAVRECFKANDYPKETENGEIVSGNILVGIRDRLYMVDGNLALARPVNGVEAIGCGAAAALGAALATPDRNPAARIELALAVASQIVEGVRPPFSFQTTKNGVLPNQADALAMKAWEGMHAGTQESARGGAKRGRR